MTATVCNFDGGPFHDATIAVSPDETGNLPVVMVTDEGDFWAVYVLNANTSPPNYRYDGGAEPDEIDQCPRVPTDAYIDPDDEED